MTGEISPFVEMTVKKIRSLSSSGQAFSKSMWSRRRRELIEGSDF
jgi:hypothetical protein